MTVGGWARPGCCVVKGFCSDCLPIVWFLPRGAARGAARGPPIKSEIVRKWLKREKTNTQAYTQSQHQTEQYTRIHVDSMCSGMTCRLVLLTGKPIETQSKLPSSLAIIKLYIISASIPIQFLCRIRNIQLHRN